MDDAAWAALALSLTVAGSIWTWVAFRRRGLASGLRALAFTLLPVAAYLTKTLQLVTGIAGEVTDWVANLVWNPLVWTGVLLGGVSVVLFVVSGTLRARRAGTDQAAAKPLKPGTKASNQPVVDDDLGDMAEIEALLRKRGIS
ncbi:hypothetical protein [Nocardioides caricicola]|uniref:Cellulose synthase n=1 Tax=Nocardioides caricicola TaxID=634770 RepID=A0ABW0N4H7_9ACTN